MCVTQMSSRGTIRICHFNPTSTMMWFGSSLKPIRNIRDVLSTMSMYLLWPSNRTAEFNLVYKKSIQLPVHFVNFKQFDLLHDTEHLNN